MSYYSEISDKAIENAEKIYNQASECATLGNIEMADLFMDVREQLLLLSQFAKAQEGR